MGESEQIRRPVPLIGFEQACRALGYDEPPVVADDSREIVIETAMEMTANGTRPADPQLASVARAQIDEFA